MSRGGPGRPRRVTPRNGVGAVIAEARVAAGLTQAELAELSGLSQSAVSKIERGDSAPEWGTIEAMANAFGCVPLLVFVRADSAPEGGPLDT